MQRAPGVSGNASLTDPSPRAYAYTRRLKKPAMTNRRSTTSVSEMVSQAHVLDRPMSPRNATSSVVSRHSRRRSGHSHHGGTTRQSQNDFPIFTHTGDVEIVIRAGGQEKRYLLHRLILAQCSGFFAASTSEEWSRQPVSAVSGPPKPDGSAMSRMTEDDTLSTGSTLAQSDVGGMSRPIEKRRLRFELDWQNKAEDEEPILVQKVGALTMEKQTCLTFVSHQGFLQPLRMRFNHLRQ